MTGDLARPQAESSDLSRPPILYLAYCIAVVTILGPSVPALVAVVAAILYHLPQSPFFDVVNWALIETAPSAFHLAFGFGGPTALIAGTVLAIISWRNRRVPLWQLLLVVGGAFIVAVAPSAADLVFGTLEHAESESVIFSNLLFTALMVAGGIGISILVALLFWHLRKPLRLQRAIDGR